MYNALKIKIISISVITALIVLFFVVTHNKKNDYDPVFDNYVYNNILNQKLEWVNTYRNIYYKDLVNKIVLLAFWRKSCVTRYNFANNLNNIKKTFGRNLDIIGIYSSKYKNEKNKNIVLEAISKYKIQYPVLLDKKSKIKQNFEIKSCAALILLDLEGNVVNNYFGNEIKTNLIQIKKDIEKLIENNKKKINQELLPVRLSLNQNINKNILNYPTKIEIGRMKNSNALFISDTGNNRIIAVNFKGKILAVIGTGMQGRNDGMFEQATFNKPHGITYYNNTLFVADTNNDIIRKIDLINKTVTTELEFENKVNHNNKKFSFKSPWDVYFVPNKNNLLISTSFFHQILEYNLTSNSIKILAGDKKPSLLDGYSQFTLLFQTTSLDSSNGNIYFTDSETSSLKVIKRNSIKTLIGKSKSHYGFENGGKSKAKLQYPLGIDVVNNKGIYIADTYNHAIRYFDFKTKKLSTVIRQNMKSESVSKLKEPSDVLRIKDTLYIVDTNNHKIKTYNLKNKNITEFKLYY